MRLIRGNVERVAADAKAERLKQEGFREMDAPAENAGIAPAQNLDGMGVAALREIAKERGLTGYSGLTRAELLDILKG